MIDFVSENGSEILNIEDQRAWIHKVLEKEDRRLGELQYVFCSDAFLLDINKRFLNHDTLTDIITFDYTEGTVVSGEIYISTDRVKENASDRELPYTQELDRVIIHGVLHLCGHPDKTDSEKRRMRSLEDLYLGLKL